MEKQNITRRNFIASTATTVAAFTIVKPSQVKGTQANSKINIGCIGFGMRGKMIAGFFNDHGRYNIKAVCDYFPQVAAEAKQLYGLSDKQIYSGLNGYKKLIAQGVDAVALETPPYCFPDHVTQAVNNNCHVYMAKPVAVDAPGTVQVKKMAASAQKKNKVFLVDFQMRTNPFTIECIKRIRQGNVGDIKTIRTFYDGEGFADPPLTKNIESRLQNLTWVNDTEIGGGYLVNADIHAIDAALWIAGDPTPVSAHGTSFIARENPHGNSTDTHTVIFRLENGKVITHNGEEMNNTNSKLAHVEAYGTLGQVHAQYLGKNMIRGRKGGYKGGKRSDLYTWGAQQNIATFHKSITNSDYSNPTVKPSINSNFASILGREACARNTTLTLKQLIKENKTFAPNLRGLTL